MSAQARDDAASWSGPITIQYEVGGKSITKKFAYLVVACDPRHLIGICDYSESEKAIFEKFVNYTFNTTLLKVKARGKVKHGVVFAPTPLNEMAGRIYGFRNETAKTFGIDAANKMDENWVTVYQLLGPRDLAWTPAKFIDVLNKELRTLAWWPYGTDYEFGKCNIAEPYCQVTTPYFDHFACDDLKNGLPWEILKRQGRQNTIFVHASTCFESILDCWSYANMLTDKSNKRRVRLPEDRGAPIAILGAGASGLLFANRLRDENYTNVEILEIKDRTDGKTYTIERDGPYPPGQPPKPTFCELGACYLSPAYDDFVKYLKPFTEEKGKLKENFRIGFAKEQEFRAIATEGQFPPGGKEVAPVIPYFDYILLKAEQETKIKDPTAIIKKMIEDLTTYGERHKKYMGENIPMPLNPPNLLLEKFGDKSFGEYLRENKLNSLVGLFQYAYSVQGYGPLDKALAYYGLVWVTPAVTDAIKAQLEHPKEHKYIVTAWSRGWGDIWDRMKVGMNITCNATTTKITRPG